MVGALTSLFMEEIILLKNRQGGDVVPTDNNWRVLDPSSFHV